MGGQHFGELAKIRGIVIHKISPYEQKAFAGAISNGVPNTFRRVSAQLFRVAPRKSFFIVYASQLSVKLLIFLAFIAGYLFYSYVESLHDSYLRKNPKDYENDV